MGKNGKRESFFNSTGAAINTANAGEKGEVNEKERQYALNENPEKFVGTFTTDYITTRELGGKINEAFGPIFEDYYGCIVTAEANGLGRNLKVDLYFRPQQASSYKEDDSRAFIPSNSEEGVSGNNINALVRRNTTAMKKTDAFSLTSYAAQILFDFLPDNLTKGNFPGGKKINWANPNSYRPLISEMPEQTESGTFVYCCVDSIDINKILGFIYGTKDQDDKSGVFYNVSIDRPTMNTSPNAIGANWVVSITRMTREQYTKTMSTLGQNPNIGRLPINTTKGMPSRI